MWRFHCISGASAEKIFMFIKLTKELISILLIYINYIHMILRIISNNNSILLPDEINACWKFLFDLPHQHWNAITAGCDYKDKSIPLLKAFQASCMRNRPSLNFKEFKSSSGTNRLLKTQQIPCDSLLSTRLPTLTQGSAQARIKDAACAKRGSSDSNGIKLDASFLASSGVPKV